MRPSCEHVKLPLVFPNSHEQWHIRLTWIHRQPSSLVCHIGLEMKRFVSRMIEKSTTRAWFVTKECCGDVDPIVLDISREFVPCQEADRRKPVKRREKFGVDSGGLDLADPANDRRHPVPSLVPAPFKMNSSFIQGISRVQTDCIGELKEGVRRLFATSQLSVDAPDVWPPISCAAVIC